MSKVYLKSYDFPVTYKNVPIDKKIVKEPLFLKTTISSTGWDLFTRKINKSIVELDLSNYETAELLVISNTKPLVVEALAGLNIVEVSPTSFTLKFEKLMTKKVPIKLNVKQNFPANFYFNKETILSPDSILITSDANELNDVNFIETSLVSINETDSIIPNIKLIIPENIRSNDVEITAKFNIEEFAEKDFIIPINIENKPNNTDLVFYPEELTLKCLIPFSDFEKIMPSDFYISADFNNIEVSKNNTLNLTIGEHPKSVKNIQLGRDKIEFIIYSN